MRSAGRLLLRDWRSGEVLVLLAALAIAVGAMSAVTFFTDRVRQAVSQQAGESLAADLRVESSRPLPDGLAGRGERRGLATAAVVSFRSVVLARDQSALADVRGVSAALSAARSRADRGRARSRPAARRERHSAARRGLGRAEPARAAQRGRRRRARRRHSASSDHEDPRVQTRRGLAVHRDLADRAVESRRRLRGRIARSRQHRAVRRAVRGQRGRDR